MITFSKSNTILLSILSILLAALLIFVYFFGDKFFTPKAIPVEKKALLTNIVKNFPKDFPFEKNASVTENYIATNSLNTNNQTTRSFETSKSLNENYALYNKYFLDNNWDIQSSQGADNFQTIVAKKDGLVIQVSVTENTITKKKVVSASVLK